MEIVQYTEKLKENILNFFKRAFKENERELNLAGKDSDLLDIENQYMKSGNFWCFLNNKGNILGTIAIRQLQDCYEIRRFFILNKYQGCGYGTQLLNISLDFAVNNNYKLVRAATMSTGNAAQHLFLQNGFKKIDRYNNSSADIFFQLELNRDSVYQYKLNYLKRKFNTSLILNPTENVPFLFEKNTNFFEGLYVSERFKDVNDKVIFAGRNDYISFFQYIKNEWKKELQAIDVDLKTLSGLNAHLILFLCILKPGEKIMVLPEICGGHFATEQILKNIGMITYQMVPDYKNLGVDSIKTMQVIQQENIKFIFVDRSEGLYYEDFSWLKDVNAYKIFDASQYISSILAGNYSNPFDMGFDMIITTLHKNYPGPQKGLIAVKKEDELWHRYLANAKTYISNTHPKAIADSLIPLVDRDSFDKYCATCSSCITLLENALLEINVPVVKRSPSCISTQHIWILCGTKQESYKYYLKLESLGLLTNYRLLPYNLGYGLRIGLNAAVLCGLQKKHISKLAKIMGDAYHNDITPRLVQTCQNFIRKIKTTAL